MPHRPAIRAGLAALLLIGAGGPAAADPADFQKALRADNAHHLREVDAQSHRPTASLVEPVYGKQDAKGPWGLRYGPLEATVELVPEKGGEAGHVFPRLRVSVSGKSVLSRDGSEAATDRPWFVAQIADMDPDNPHAEIVFSSYTGGAHCCSQTYVATGSKDGSSWTAVDAGGFDGGLVTATDLDGDDRFEIAVRDNRFLYAFDCYACSAAPLQVLQLQGDRLVDVSAHKAFRDAHRETLVAMVQNYGRGSEGANGFLAGYVAQKIRLGEGKQAWDFMLKYYDKKHDWGLESCSVAVDANGDCPGRTLKLTFPEALGRFLKESGYPVPN